MILDLSIDFKRIVFYKDAPKIMICSIAVHKLNFPNFNGSCISV